MTTRAISDRDMLVIAYQIMLGTAVKNGIVLNVDEIRRKAEQYRSGIDLSDKDDVINFFESLYREALQVISPDIEVQNFWKDENEELFLKTGYQVFLKRLGDATISRTTVPEMVTTAHDMLSFIGHEYEKGKIHLFICCAIEDLVLSACVGTK